MKSFFMIQKRPRCGQLLSSGPHSDYDHVPVISDYGHAPVISDYDHAPVISDHDHAFEVHQLDCTCVMDEEEHVICYYDHNQRMSDSDSAGRKLLSVDFEIFGHVQGVCFRMYTESEGLRRGLVGWVKNTCSGTVVGQVQGPAEKVEDMKVWLSKEGSPSSRITRASFTNQRNIDKLELSGFKTRF
ncbi:acylphosphatase-2-like isoform X1 [Solea senegalensis]|uniref:Acylphosphatase n=1 Tax=Solea senegalensis TaxID=28829 RepID=A0AAV6PMR7_SOLSE|nr:acylphosphatase-2-like isoform X2 [Solea senegalensis]KAG7473131.1 acylphosphatase-2-like isoform X1 [Solea senegalensis]